MTEMFHSLFKILGGKVISNKTAKFQYKDAAWGVENPSPVPLSVCSQTRTQGRHRTTSHMSKSWYISHMSVQVTPDLGRATVSSYGALIEFRKKCFLWMVELEKDTSYGWFAAPQAQDDFVPRKMYPLPGGCRCSQSTLLTESTNGSSASLPAFLA